MLRPYNKALKAEFHRLISKRLPEFRKAGTDFGGVIYRKETRDGHVFIFLLPAPQHNRLTIEVAYSRGSGYPFDVLPGDKGKSGEFRVRLMSLLGEKIEKWWNVDEGRSISWEEGLRSQTVDPQRLTAVPSLVQDAMAALEVGLPKFEERIRE